IFHFFEKNQAAYPGIAKRMIKLGMMLNLDVTHLMATFALSLKAEGQILAYHIRTIKEPSNFTPITDPILLKSGIALTINARYLMNPCNPNYSPVDALGLLKNSIEITP